MLHRAEYAASIHVFTADIDFQSFGVDARGFFGDFASTMQQVELGRMNFEHRFSHFTDLVLVHNAEEAANYPDNIIAAWPDEDRVDRAIAGIYWAINRPAHELPSQLAGGTPRQPVTLEEFGLTYPLTAADFVDNWQGVNELLSVITSGEWITINRHINRGDPLPGQDQ